MASHQHDYIQVDIDGTVECTTCGLRNSDPSANEELCHHCDGEVENVGSSYCCKGCEDAEEVANDFDY